VKSRENANSTKSSNFYWTEGKSKESLSWIWLPACIVVGLIGLIIMAVGD
jgi:hypothetical protein